MRLPPFIIVDDNAADLAAIGTALQDRYCNPVLGFCDAEGAIQFLSHDTEDGAPAAILTDMALPGAHGLEFVKWCKTQARLRHVPVVAVTATPDLSGLVALKLGACAVIPKPTSVHAVDQFLLTRHELTIVSGIDGKAALFSSPEDALRALSDHSSHSAEMAGMSSATSTAA